MTYKLWEPEKDTIESSHLIQFTNKINENYKLNLRNFSEIHTWSINNPNNFWADAADYFNIEFKSKPTSIVNDINAMPNTKWFEGATLNYAEHCLKNKSNDLAIYEITETGLSNTLSKQQLYDLVSKWVQFFIDQDIKKGDSVAGILPNNLTALIAMLATTAIGAVWSSCSPDFGEKGICDRLEQINPKCIISISNYRYKEKTINITNRLNQIRSRLSNTSCWINTSSETIENWISLNKIKSYSATEIKFIPCKFQDPLFILFSSGTTGKPKCIVHSVGGTLIQHLKEHQFHCNLKETDTLFYYTTCGWMMWNWMVTALASNASLVLYDGAALTQTFSIWNLIEKYNITVFGCSASFISVSQKRNIDISNKLSNKSVRLILSTGSPLLPNHYDYLYSSFTYPIQVGSISGGTDIISCFALCNPITPVYKGLIQGKGLGMDIASYDEHNNELTGQKGELVCKASAPCMPVYFLHDPDYKKYKSAYFKNGTVSNWFHGDYIIVHKNGSIEILGRSDSTLNPGGIRMGSSEFYDILDSFNVIEDSLVSSILSDNEEKIVLFIKLKPNESLTPTLKKNIRYHLKEEASPRHMPQMIVEVSQIPYTINGKKCDSNVKKILHGESVIIEPSTLLKENSFSEYYQFVEQLKN